MTSVVLVPTKSLCFHYRSLYNYLNFMKHRLALNILISTYSLRYIKFVLIICLKKKYVAARWESKFFYTSVCKSLVTLENS
jgi:hypothetical protein